MCRLCANIHKGLKHPGILVSKGDPGTNAPRIWRDDWTMKLEKKRREKKEERRVKRGEAVKKKKGGRRGEGERKVSMN